MHIFVLQHVLKCSSYAIAIEQLGVKITGKNTLQMAITARPCSITQWMIDKDAETEPGNEHTLEQLPSAGQASALSLLNRDIIQSCKWSILSSLIFMTLLRWDGWEF